MQKIQLKQQSNQEQQFLEVPSSNFKSKNPSFNYQGLNNILDESKISEQQSIMENSNQIIFKNPMNSYQPAIQQSFLSNNPQDNEYEQTRVTFGKFDKDYNKEEDENTKEDSNKEQDYQQYKINIIKVENFNNEIIDLMHSFRQNQVDQQEQIIQKQQIQEKYQNIMNQLSQSNIIQENEISFAQNNLGVPLQNVNLNDSINEMKNLIEKFIDQIEENQNTQEKNDVEDEKSEKSQITYVTQKTKNSFKTNISSKSDVLAVVRKYKKLERQKSQNNLDNIPLGFSGNSDKDAEYLNRQQLYSQNKKLNFTSAQFYSDILVFCPGCDSQQQLTKYLVHKYKCQFEYQNFYKENVSTSDNESQNNSFHKQKINNKIKSIILSLENILKLQSSQYYKDFILDIIHIIRKFLNPNINEDTNLYLKELDRKVDE